MANVEDWDVPFPMTNSTTFNLESVLRQNILISLYYKNTCTELNTWEEVVDEIYENVHNVEPWMSGNARGPSTAFCLMYRLFTLKITSREVKNLLDHKDSPYIRAVGYLYLRYVCDPKELWKWCSPHAAFREELTPSPDGKVVTIGDFVRDLMLEQYYFETIFPRIPKPTMDQIADDLKSRGLPYTGKGNAGAGGVDRRGVDDGNKRPASVKASLSVAMGQRAPNRAGAREERSNVLVNKSAANGSDRGRAGGRRPSPGLEEEGGRRSPTVAHRGGPSTSGRERDRDGDRGRDKPAYDRGRDRDSGRPSERDRPVDRDSGRERGRDEDRGPRYDRRDSDRDAVRDKDRQSYRPADRDRASDRDRPADKDRARSRSRERGGPDRGADRGGDRGGRDARDVFRDSARPAAAASSADPNALRARYG